MALPGDATDLTSFTEIVQSEHIIPRVLEANLKTAIFQHLAWIYPVPEGEGASVAIPQFQSWAPTAGNKTEGAAFSRVEMTTTETTMSSGVVGAGVFVSGELKHDMLIRQTSFVAGNAVRGMINRVDTDVVAEIGNATNTADHGDVAFTTTLLNNDQATFAGQVPFYTRLGLVLSEIQFRDLKNSMDASTAAQFGNDAQSATVRTLRGAMSGFKGMYEDMEVYVTTTVPNAASKDSGAILSIGEGGALVYGIWDPITMTPEANPEYYGFDMWFSARYGTTVSVQANMLEILSSDD